MGALKQLAPLLAAQLLANQEDEEENGTPIATIEPTPTYTPTATPTPTVTPTVSEYTF